MSKYTLSKNGQKQELKDEEILKYKNFGKLVYNYERAIKPLYRLRTWRHRWLFITLLVILITFIIIALEEGW